LLPTFNPSTNDQKNKQHTNNKDQLKEDGKISFLDKPHHIEAINAMNEQLADVKREYQIKDRNSQIAALMLL